jgi:hypothetical protein
MASNHAEQKQLYGVEARRAAVRRMKRGHLALCGVQMNTDCDCGHELAVAYLEGR